MNGAWRERRATWALAGLALLVQLPLLDRGLSLYDEGSILAIADGLQQGELLYRDRYTTLGPLCYELLGGLFRLFGPELWVARLLQAGIFLACVLLVHRVLLDLVPRRWAWLGALSCLGLKTLAFPFWTELNYAPFALVLALATMLGMQRYLAAHSPRWLIGVGIGIGLTALTKQNLGATLALSVAATLGFDAWLHRIGPRRLAARLGIGLATALLPLGVALGYYAARGGLGDFLTGAVWGALGMPGLYGLSFPALGIWPLDDADLGRLRFAYFPGALVHLAWEGGLGRHPLLAQRSIELGVKLAYYLPLLALGLGAWTLARRTRGQGLRAGRSRWLLLLTFAAACYASLYRADWTHLMSVYPIFLVLGTALLASRAQRTPWARPLALGLLGVWLAAAAALGLAVAHVYTSPVESARGRLLAPAQQAELAQSVLRHLASRPKQETILILRSDPLLYFLAGRRIPGRLDLVMPGIVSPQEDVRLAEVLHGVERIIYNSAVFPTLPLSIADYAPASAERIAREFRITSHLHERTYALERYTPDPPVREDLIDLWTDYGGTLTKIRNMQQVHWLHYRVLAAGPDPTAPESCFVRGHAVRRDEAILTVPLSHPDVWDSPDEIVFEIRRLAKKGGSWPVHAETRSRGSLPEPLLVPFADLPEGFTELEFCIRRKHERTKGKPARPLRAGWGEPRIVRLATLR